MTKPICRACQAGVEDAFLCEGCTTQLERTLADLPGLINDVATRVVRQTRTYRASGRRREPDQDWRGAEHALRQTPEMVDFDASALLAEVRNSLTTWARHIMESRGLDIVLGTANATMAGPACAAHAHDFSVDGCGLQPEQCKQLHPGHVHDYSRKGCAHDRDPETGELICTLLHCEHESCAVIRHGELTGIAATLVRWFMSDRVLGAIRQDEAAAQFCAAMDDLHAVLDKAVDRAPSALYAGPCHATVIEVHSEERNGTVYVTTSTGQCQRDLYTWPNAEEIVCNGYRSDTAGDQGCGAVHSLAEREHWLRAAVDDALLPLATWQTALPKLLPQLTWPTRSTWWRWLQAERLTARSVDRSATELYRGGDLVDLVRAEQPRIRGNASKAKHARLSA